MLLFQIIITFGIAHYTLDVCRTEPLRPREKRNKTDPTDVPKSLVWFRSFLKSLFHEILDKPTQRH